MLALEKHLTPKQLSHFRRIKRHILEYIMLQRNPKKNSSHRLIFCSFHKWWNNMVKGFSKLTRKGDVRWYFNVWNKICSIGSGEDIILNTIQKFSWMISIE